MLSRRCFFFAFERSPPNDSGVREGDRGWVRLAGVGATCTLEEEVPLHDGTCVAFGFGNAMLPGLVAGLCGFVGVAGGDGVFRVGFAGDCCFAGGGGVEGGASVMEWSARVVVAEDGGSCFSSMVSDCWGVSTAFGWSEAGASEIGWSTSMALWVGRFDECKSCGRKYDGGGILGCRRRM